MATRIEQNPILTHQTATIEDVLPQVKHVRPIDASETPIAFPFYVAPDQLLRDVHSKIVKELDYTQIIGFEPCTPDGTQPLQSDGGNPRIFIGMGIFDQSTDSSGHVVLQTARREPWDRSMHIVRPDDFVLPLPDAQYAEGSGLRHAA